MKKFKHSKSTPISKTFVFFIVLWVCGLIALMLHLVKESMPSTPDAISKSAYELSVDAIDYSYQPTGNNESGNALKKKETQPRTESTTNTEPTTNKTYNYSGDADLLARVIYLESGDCSEYCQWLVGSTAMNLADKYGGLEIVAYDYSIFNVAYDIDYCTPSDLSYAVAERVLSGDRDYVVNAFRDDYYHDWATPYTNVDNMYFSTY